MNQNHDDLDLYEIAQGFSQLSKLTKVSTTTSTDEGNDNNNNKNNDNKNRSSSKATSYETIRILLADSSISLSPDMGGVGSSINKLARQFRHSHHPSSRQEEYQNKTVQEHVLEFDLADIVIDSRKPLLSSLIIWLNDYYNIPNNYANDNDDDVDDDNGLDDTVQEELTTTNSSSWFSWFSSSRSNEKNKKTTTKTTKTSKNKKRTATTTTLQQLLQPKLKPVIVETPEITWFHSLEIILRPFGYEVLDYQEAMERYGATTTTDNQNNKDGNNKTAKGNGTGKEEKESSREKSTYSFQDIPFLIYHRNTADTLHTAKQFLARGRRRHHRYGYVYGNGTTKTGTRRILNVHPTQICALCPQPVPQQHHADVDDDNGPGYQETIISMDDHDHDDDDNTTINNSTNHQNENTNSVTIHYLSSTEIHSDLLQWTRQQILEKRRHHRRRPTSTQQNEAKEGGGGEQQEQQQVSTKVFFPSNKQQMIYEIQKQLDHKIFYILQQIKLEKEGKRKSKEANKKTN